MEEQKIFLFVDPEGGYFIWDDCCLCDCMVHNSVPFSLFLFFYTKLCASRRKMILARKNKRNRPFSPVLCCVTYFTYVITKKGKIRLVLSCNAFGTMLKNYFLAHFLCTSHSGQACICSVLHLKK